MFLVSWGNLGASTAAESLGPGARIPGFRSRPSLALGMTFGKLPNRLAPRFPHL